MKVKETGRETVCPYFLAEILTIHLTNSHSEHGPRGRARVKAGKCGGGGVPAPARSDLHGRRGLITNCFIVYIQIPQQSCSAAIFSTQFVFYIYYYCCCCFAWLLLLLLLLFCLCCVIAAVVDFARLAWKETLVSFDLFNIIALTLTQIVNLHAKQGQQ